jgi:hypothetical protein
LYHTAGDERVKPKRIHVLTGGRDQIINIWLFVLQLVEKLGVRGMSSGRKERKPLAMHSLEALRESARNKINFLVL